MTSVQHFLIKPYIIALIIFAIVSVMFVITSGIPALIFGLIAMFSAAYILNCFMNHLLDSQVDFRAEHED